MSNLRRLEPLGDQGVFVVANSEAAAQGLAQLLLQRRPDWLVDVVVAYHSLAIFYDQDKTEYAQVVAAVESLPIVETAFRGRLFKIPCCYELGPDLGQVAQHCQCSPDEVVALHSRPVYQVYALGFVPGFPYLGYLPERLAKVPRLASPRPRVEPGSVGIAGRQTGIYPAAVPGGWHLIGRTPLVIAEVESGFLPLRVGDRVQFQPINVSQFEAFLGQRLDDRWVLASE